MLAWTFRIGILLRSYLKLHSFQSSAKYTTLVNGTQLIESSLHKNLIEHLNAEIVLQTISDMNLVVEWIRQTFLYVRALKNPCFYENGKLMARYCIAFETMKHFGCIDKSQENIAEMIKTIAHCAEFDDVQLRINEKRILNSLNRDKNKETIRFPLPGKIKTKQMKVNCLIQAQLSCLPVQDFSLSQDMAKIFRVGQRVAKCLMEFMYHGNCYSVLLHAVLVYKAFKAKLWFDSRYVARQLEGIGSFYFSQCTRFAFEGRRSYADLIRKLILRSALCQIYFHIVNRHPPFGNQVKEALNKLPRYELSVEQTKCYKPHKCVLVLNVDLLNRSTFETVPSSQITHQSILIIGDADNTIVFKWRIFDAAIFRDGMLSRSVEVNRASEGTKLSISLLSLDTVGLDIQTEYEPVYQEGWFPTYKRSSTSEDQTPASKLKKVMDKAKADISATPSSVLSKSSCNHKCINKLTCGHKCCKSSDLRKRPAAQKMSGVRPESSNKSPKIEKTSYRESKEMKDVLGIFGVQRSGPRLKMSKQMAAPQEQTNCSKPEEVSGHGPNIERPPDLDEFEDNDLSDVIILDDDMLEGGKGSTDFPCISVDSGKAERVEKNYDNFKTTSNTINSHNNKSTPTGHLTEMQHRQHHPPSNVSSESGKYPPQVIQAQKLRNQNVLGNQIAPAENTKLFDYCRKREQNGFSVTSKQKICGRGMWEKEDHLWRQQELESKALSSEDTEEQQAESTLDIEVNGWADLDMFHQSRKSLFRNGRPIHLRDDDFEDDLPSLTNTPELRPLQPLSPLQQPQKHQQMQGSVKARDDADCQWITTNSSDEELCYLVDGGTCPPGGSSYSQSTNIANVDMSGYGRIQDHTSDHVDLHVMSEQDNLLRSSSKVLNCIPRATRSMSASDDQNKNFVFNGSYQTPKAHQEMQRVLVAEDGIPEVKHNLPTSVGSEFRAISNLKDQILSKSVHSSTKPNMSSVHDSIDTLLSEVISLTDSDPLHSASVSSHTQEGKHLQNELYGDACEEAFQHINSVNLYEENVSQPYIGQRNAEITDNFNTDSNFHSKASDIPSKSSASSKQAGPCQDQKQNVKTKSPHSSHRYGHVLAWNKTNGRFGQQVC
ncbi:HFM1, ATP-dependent DNA helicase homolog [Elysia marginata]|uniref:HFM1, ATP-dependent DNA helicase homolog n=1 Tax=Elysia marginata TaxID=1093978 RepID=A0AAV4IJS6_9GAST|nr:HFM1, ATP-dependent DNA helicase homolog [Elysia marginata]